MRINTPKFDTQREQAKNGRFTTKTLITERADAVINRIRERPAECISVHDVGAGGDDGTEFVR